MKPVAGLQPPPRPLSPFSGSRGSTAGPHVERGRVGAAANPGMGNFANLLVDQVRQVNVMQTSADEQVHALLTGGDVNEAEVLTNVQKADLAFRMLLQIRNKLIEAYREVQQIQI